jgi:hypothetical protein
MSVEYIFSIAGVFTVAHVLINFFNAHEKHTSMGIVIPFLG